MKTMRSLFVGLLTLTLAVGALAAIEDPYQTHQETVEFGPENCNWTTGLAIPKFDNSPNGVFAGCYLTSVNLEFRGEVSGFFRFENESAMAGDVTATLGALLVLKNPGGNPILTLNPVWTETEFVAAYDDTTDFGGSSGRSYEDLLESASGSVFYDECFMMNGFSGIGSLNFPAEAYASSSASGPGTLSLQVQTNAAVYVTVTYTYYCPDCEIEIVNVENEEAPDEGATVTFRVSGTPPAQVTEYRWDFGDGNPEVITYVPEVTHVYAASSPVGDPYPVSVSFTHRWANGQATNCEEELDCELEGGIVRTQNVNWSQIKALYR